MFVFDHAVQMAARFRKWEKASLASGTRTTRQLIVAVTANGGQLGKQNEDSDFDDVLLKPLSAADIQRLVEVRIK